MAQETQHLEVNPVQMEKFLHAVNSEMDKEVDEIIAEAQNAKNELISIANDEALQLAYDRIKENVKLLSAKYFKLVAKAELDSKKEVLIHREELIKKLFKNVEDQISEFRKSSAYVDFLKKQLKESNIENGAIILINPDDMKYKDNLTKELPSDCLIKEDLSIKYGGVSILYPSKNIVIDKTIDNSLKEERAEFNRKNCFSLN